MPENDIYNSKERYEQFVQNLDLLLIPPEKRADRNGYKSLYYCKHPENLTYFRALCQKFDALDRSYIRRCRLLNTLRLICHATEKDLRACDREDIDQVVAFMHTRYQSQKSKGDFVKDMKYIWRHLFPEKDEKGRIDETITPYAVRHLKANGDKSREKARLDKLTWDEFEKLVGYFADHPCLQAYIAIAAESLARPQETLYTRIKDLELHENYAKLHLTDHTKEGIGFLQIIDSFPYMLKWYQQHPLKDNPGAFLFLNQQKKQLTPFMVNKHLRKACAHLGIHKPITAYSLKRNGVTFSRLRGESDVEIQHKARWTSTKQLKTYDLSEQEDSLKMALAKRGLLKDTKYQNNLPRTKSCPFCGWSRIGFTEKICPKCLHIIDREMLKEQQNQERALQQFFSPEAIQGLFKVVYKLQKEIQALKR